MHHTGFGAALLLSIVLVCSPMSGAVCGGQQQLQGETDGGQTADLAAQMPRIAPKNPAESARAIAVHPDFRVELVVAEPLVRDPVSIDFDENGRIYVAELPEYNGYAVEGYEEQGAIRLIEDSDGDGTYDRSTVFANVDYPTAVACWNGGVFVGAAPDLLFLKDTDGDGKSDYREALFSGFGSDRAGESHLNSFRWGLEHRYFMAASNAGGDVRVVGDTDSKPVSVRRRTIVFDPRDPRHFFHTSGGGQHGMSRDQWGRWFVCSNSVPAKLIMYDDRYLARNPYTTAAPVAVEIMPDRKYTKLFRISPPEPWRVVRTRWRSEGRFAGSDEGGTPFGFFTGATGVTIYRGDAWPEAYRGNLFVGDVANNIVHRARIKQDGLAVVAERADKGAEFLASRDIWFRPAQFANAPDGNLYVLDVYRELIECASCLPTELLEHVNAVGGNDRGRIYRIVYAGADPPTPRRGPPRLGRATTTELVDLLRHPNGWHRDTASRLLYERQDPQAVTPLRALARNATEPIGRLTAMYALNGLGHLDDETLMRALGDASTHVRRHAVRLSEQRVAHSAAIRRKLTAMADDPDLLVRYQLAFSLGAWSDEAQTTALVKLAHRDGDIPWMRMAIHSSLSSDAGRVLRLLAESAAFRDTSHGRKLLSALARQIGATRSEGDIAKFSRCLDELSDTDAPLAERLVESLLRGAGSARQDQVLQSAGSTTRRLFRRLLARARKTAADRQTTAAERKAAIERLALSPFSEIEALMAELLQPQEPQPVHHAALSVLAEYDESDAAAIILDAWPALSPQLRNRALEVILSRASWITMLLDAIEQGHVAQSAIAPARVQVLAQHPDTTISQRISELFSDRQMAGRENVIAEYQQALLHDGSAERGREVFRRNCSACHQLEGEGTAVGADLKGIRNRGLATVLVNILDPNRQVQPEFLSYMVATVDGRIVTGMIQEETTNSVTIRQPDGTSTTISRIDIDEFRETGLSFMPEGLEKEIDVPAMSDLLAYLDSLR